MSTDNSAKTENSIKTVPEKIVLELTGRDRIELLISSEGQIQSLEILGCATLRLRLNTYIQNNGLQIISWDLPLEHDHISLMVKELILKAQKNWRLPISDIELCHCRAITTETVKMAIMAGAHDAESVSRQTGAATGCGTCKTDIESMLSYILK